MAGTAVGSCPVPATVTVPCGWTIPTPFIPFPSSIPLFLAGGAPHEGGKRGGCSGDDLLLKLTQAAEVRGLAAVQPPAAVLSRLLQGPAHLADVTGIAEVRPGGIDGGAGGVGEDEEAVAGVEEDAGVLAIVQVVEAETTGPQTEGGRGEVTQPVPALTAPVVANRVGRGSGRRWRHGGCGGGEVRGQGGQGQLGEAEEDEECQ